VHNSIVAIAGVTAVLVGVGVVNSHRAEEVSKAALVAPPPASVEVLMPPAASTLGCHGGGSHVRPDGIASMRLDSSNETIASWHCVDARGRHPSSTRVFRGIPGLNAVAVTTLISPSQNLSVQTFKVVRHTVEITAVAAIAEDGSAWNWAGRAVRMSFTTSDGEAFLPGATEWFGEPCTAPTLTVREWTPSWWVGEQTALLRFTNTGSRSCVVSGYPTVTAVDSKGTHRVIHTLNGPFGGLVSSPDPPIVVLDPNDVATALLEARAANGACGRSDRLEVSLDNFADPVSVPYAIDLCGLQVHPLTDQFLGPTS
jgi:hypothetical protein